jgi:2-oxoisovalerate ferredoxin oxidoreductase alpha subunit
MSLIDGFNNARQIIPKVFKEYTDKFGRLGDTFIEVTGDIDSAECAIIALGTLGEEAEQTVEYLAKSGTNIVVYRPRVFRPFPKKELIELVRRVPRILIIDRAVSFGNAGHLAIEIQAELYSQKVGVKVYQKIMGLGGRDVTYVDLANEVKKVLEEDNE